MATGDVLAALVLGKSGYLRDATPEELAPCGARWEILKALVLGKRGVDGFTPPAQCAALMAQRDAVFAGLAEMVLLERTALKAQSKVDNAFPYERFHVVGGGDHRANQPSHARLWAYTQFLVDQIEVLR